MGAIVGCLAFISVYNGAVFMKILTQAPERLTLLIDAIVREPLVARAFRRLHSR